MRQRDGEHLLTSNNIKRPSFTLKKHLKKVTHLARLVGKAFEKELGVRFLDLFADPEFRERHFYCWDQLHLTKEGYERLGQLLRPHLLKGARDWLQKPLR